MATAKVTQKSIPVTTYKQGPKVYTLTLTVDEALALQAITGRVLGSTALSPRKYSSRIYWTLDRILGPVNNQFADELTKSVKFDNLSMSNIEDEPEIKAELVNYGRDIELTLGANAAKTVQALVGRVQIPSGPNPKTYAHTHEIFEALSSAGISMSFPVSDEGYGSFYNALNENIVLKAVEEETSKVVEKPYEAWPPKLHDVWTVGSTHWIAAKDNADGGKIKLYVSSLKNPTWFKPEEVKYSFPEIKLVYRDGK